MAKGSPPSGTPWYESNLLWSPAAFGGAIIITVVADRHLRWLLWFAWPCFGVTIWWLARRTREVTLVTVLGVIVAGGLLLGLSSWLRPEQSITKTALPLSPASEPIPQAPASNPSPAQSPEAAPKIATSKKPKHAQTSQPSKPVPVEPPGSLVQSNSGGLNIQQGSTGSNSPIIDSPITVGNIPRDINPRDMASITRYLSGAPKTAQIRIIADQFSGNAPLPDKFYDALKDSGWTMLDAGVSQMIAFSAPGKKFQGAIVLVKGEALKPNEGVYFDSSDPVAYIGTVLTSLKIPRVLQRVPNQPDGQITIQFEGGFP